MLIGIIGKYKQFRLSGKQITVAYYFAKTYWVLTIGYYFHLPKNTT